MAEKNNMYYEKNPDVAHNISEFTFELRGKKFRFLTDSGVFSKKTIDYGSRVLIDAFDDSNLPEGAILDVGAGYGPIGLSLSFATGRPVEMVDVNERALGLAQQNAERNGIEQAEIHVSNMYDAVEKTDFAAIVSNPPIRAGKTVVHGILEGAYAHLKTGGTLTIVIQKKQGAPSAQKKMEEVFGNVEVVTKDKGYFILRSVKD
jgi:16S rRNA (guanine1207-N2)-methyltransferase